MENIPAKVRVYRVKIIKSLLNIPNMLQPDPVSILEVFNRLLVICKVGT